VRPTLRAQPRPQQFFFAAVATDEQLRREVFYLSYHLHWSRAEIVGLDVTERRAFVQLLAEEIDRQNRAYEDVRRTR
jgi:hypothetical protein